MTDPLQLPRNWPHCVMGRPSPWSSFAAERDGERLDNPAMLEVTRDAILRTLAEDQAGQQQQR